MTKTLQVTPAQVLLAQLAVELSEEEGVVPDEALKAIASAKVVPPQQSAPSHETSSVSQALFELAARLQRIEDQVQALGPDTSGHERSQPSTQPEARTSDEMAVDNRGIQDPTYVTANPRYQRKHPWNRDADDDVDPLPVDSPTPQGVKPPTIEWGDTEKPQVGEGAQEPVADRFVDPTMSDEKAARILAEHEPEQRERQQEGRDPERPQEDRDRGGPQSMDW